MSASPVPASRRLFWALGVLAVLEGLSWTTLPDPRFHWALTAFLGWLAFRMVLHNRRERLKAQSNPAEPVEE